MFYRHYHLQRSEYYYQRLFPSDYGVFKKWINHDSEKTFKSAANISYRNIPFGKNRDFIISHTGKPRYEIKETDDFINYNVLFYKTVIHGIKLIMQFHLMNNIFFFGNHTFSNVEHTKFNTVISLLIKKYCNGQGKRGENTHSVSDDSGNKIFIVDDVILRLCYLTGNDKVKESLIKSEWVFSNKRTPGYMDIYQSLSGIL